MAKDGAGQKLVGTHPDRSPDGLILAVDGCIDLVGILLISLLTILISTFNARPGK